MSGRLKLLADQLKISILERNRLIGLDITPTSEDEEELEHSLRTLLQGIKSLDGNGTEYKSDALQDEIAFLRREYRELHALFKNEEYTFEGQSVGIETTDYSGTPYRDDPETAMESLLPERGRKSVRFTDALVDADASNSDLLQLQNQVMRDQDSSLDVLSASIGRQRELSIQIGNELDEHGELIDDMTEGVDRSSRRLDQAKQKLTNFSRKARGNSHLLTIIVLIVVLVLLISL